QGERADEQGRGAAAWPDGVHGHHEDGADGRDEDGAGDEHVDLRGCGGRRHRVTTAASAGSVTASTSTGATPSARTARARTAPGTVWAEPSSPLRPGSAMRSAATGIVR